MLCCPELLGHKTGFYGYLRLFHAPVELDSGLVPKKTHKGDKHV